MRTREEIQQEYNNVCAHLGSNAYRIKVIGEDFESQKGKMQKEFQSLTDTLNSEIQKQVSKLKELALEAQALPKDESAKHVEAEVVE